MSTETSAWDNPTAAAVAAALEDRGKFAAAAWLAEHENDTEIVTLIDRALDEVICLHRSHMLSGQSSLETADLVSRRQRNEATRRRLAAIRTFS